jgi:predicted  nucleic acid-binding Zn-ribbon protein
MPAAIIGQMLNEALNKVARVQKVDAAILELQRRIASIDPGKATQGRLDEAKREFDEADGRLHAIRGELKDLELESKKCEGKIKSENDRLYSGGIYNAKDAEAIDREVKNLKERISAIDSRILELWEELPPAEETAKGARSRLDEAESVHGEYVAEYGSVRSELEGKLGQLVSMRPKAIEGCDPSVVQKYESMRGKHQGIGIAVVDGEECSICRTRVPKLLKDAILSGADLETCEGCGRYLYIEVES